MLKKSVLAVVVAALLMSVMLAGVPAALADGGGQLVQIYDEDAENWVTCIADGRINGCQIDAPVAIYTTTSTPILDAYGQFEWNTDGTMAFDNAVTGVEMWGLASGYDNLIKVISLGTDEIQAAIAASGGADTILAQAYGYSLGYSASGYLWLTAPDGYSFTWEGGALLG